MNDVTPRGNIVIGVMLVLTGLAILLERGGAFHWSDQWTLWPLILGGLGLARLLDTAPGEPKQGLVFLTAAAWLGLSEAGWVSLEESWPIVVIALGLIIAFNGSTRRPWPWHVPDRADGSSADPTQARWRRPRRPGRQPAPLAVLGTWIAIIVAFQVSGVRSLSEADTADHVRVVSVMGRSEHISRATAFQGADITNVMGRSDLDLREATVGSGASAEVHVFSVMGAVVMRVPPTWTVDTGALSAFGGVRDMRAGVAEADAAAEPAPRLVLRGLVMFGRLTITT